MTDATSAGQPGRSAFRETRPDGENQATQRLEPPVGRLPGPLNPATGWPPPPTPAGSAPMDETDDQTAVLSLDDLMDEPVTPAAAATPLLAQPVAQPLLPPAPVRPATAPQTAATPSGAAAGPAATPPAPAQPRKQPSVDWTRVRTDAVAAYAGGLRRGREWLLAADNALIIGMVVAALLLLLVVGAH